MSDVAEQYPATWNAGPTGEESAVIGFDVVVLDAGGRIRHVRGSLDKVPA